MNLKILYLYPDMLDLYGDTGNIEVIQYRSIKRNIKCIVDKYSINDKKPNFEDYDLIFIGGGADLEQQILANDLIKYREDINSAMKNGVFFLLICGGYQLFGKYYKDSNGVVIPGLEVFDYYTEASLDKKKRCIGNIVIECILNDECTKIIGFENHGGQTKSVVRQFGKVLYGNGNCFDSNEEGFMIKNVIGTYLHGPLLSKNPILADYIIKYCLERKYNERIVLDKLDDQLENKCRDYLFELYLRDKKY